MRSLPAVLAALLTAGCGDGPPRMPTSPTPVVFSQHASARFVFHHTQLDAASIARTAATVEAEYARILGDLGVTSMPTASVFLYPDFVSMQRAVSAAVGALPAGYGTMFLLALVPPLWFRVMDPLVARNTRKG